MLVNGSDSCSERISPCLTLNRLLEQSLHETHSDRNIHIETNTSLNITQESMVGTLCLLVLWPRGDLFTKSMHCLHSIAVAGPGFPKGTNLFLDNTIHWLTWACTPFRSNQNVFQLQAVLCQIWQNCVYWCNPLSAGLTPSHY